MNKDFCQKLMEFVPEMNQDFCEAQKLMFGKWPIHPYEVFLWSPLSMALVNTKPLVPHHVLVCPRRVESQYLNLSPEEQRDLWRLARLVALVIKGTPTSDAHVTFSVQNGRLSGQTVDHVHIHIMPATVGMSPDVERTEQTEEEMRNESTTLTARFVHLVKSNAVPSN
ncbi:MAG: uncharacterized protein KVP18_005193 [Porospora cf. gigantea A]|uniref:uncharacterized protein n=1 Tax=Porospora cf. gigantea A TaxID=2853593 RepID=UPI00355AB25A|nr:MAG: hypothetical protein KVP18_005193 [Porospora cf. gigantea A]